MEDCSTDERLWQWLCAWFPFHHALNIKVSSYIITEYNAGRWLSTVAAPNATAAAAASVMKTSKSWLQLDKIMIQLAAIELPISKQKQHYSGFSLIQTCAVIRTMQFSSRTRITRSNGHYMQLLIPRLWLKLCLTVLRVINLCMYMYVCMYVCMYNTYACIYACVY